MRRATQLLAVVPALDVVLHEWAPVTASAAAAKFGVELLQRAGAELADRYVAERGPDGALDIAEVAVAGGVLDVGRAQPLVDGIGECHRGARRSLLVDACLEFRKDLVGLSVRGLVGALDGLGEVVRFAGDGIDAGVDADLERVAALPGVFAGR